MLLVLFDHSNFKICRSMLHHYRHTEGAMKLKTCKQLIFWLGVLIRGLRGDFKTVKACARVADL